MKSKIILLSLCIAACFSSKAQVRLDPFYPYSKWTFGLGVGYSELYGDLAKSNSEAVVHLHLDRNANEWVSYGLEIQHGGLSSYEPKNHWTSGLSVNNNFTGASINGKVCLGELFNHPTNFFTKTIFGLYVGVGAGYMLNDISNATLKFKKQDVANITEYSPSSLKTSTGNFYVPFIAGFNLHVSRRVMFNVNYEFAYAMSDYIDSYNFLQPVANNQYNDMFSVLTFGLDFYLGKIGGKGRSSYRTRHN